MTYPTEITLAFADGQYRFWLPMAQINEFENKHGSILSVEPRLASGIGIDEKGNAIYAGGGEGDAKVIRDIIRLGLIGGDQATVDGIDVEVGPRRAAELIDAYVFPARPLAEAAAIAWRILAALIYGTAPEAKTTEPVADGEPDV